MSDLHPLPLMGHDLETRPVVRAHVFRTTPEHWWWAYQRGAEVATDSVLRHGPFESQPEAFASAWRMVEAL